MAPCSPAYSTEPLDQTLRTIAVVISRLTTGTWQKRTSERIDLLHDKLEAEYVQLDEPLNRAGDMITPFNPVDNYAGPVALAAPPQANPRRTEAVRELVKRVLDRIEL